MGGNCEAGRLVEEEVDRDDPPNLRGVVVEHATVAHVQQQLRSSDLPGDGLADVVVGVERCDVAGVLVAGEELRVLFGTGRVLAGHWAADYSVPFSLLPVPDRAEFDRYSDSYREAVEDSISFAGVDLDFFTRAKARLLLELADDALGAADGLTFLDVGCGPGETDRLLKGRVRSLAGVDVASGMLERARRSNPWAEYRDYSAGEPLPFEQGTFDVSFAICVFHHVPREQRISLVEEMIRVCRPGGLVVLFEHNPLNPLTRKAVRGCEFDRDAELLTRREASRLLAEAGLSPRGRYIEFFTRDSRLLRGVESRLGWLPLGAQYAVFAHRS